MAAICSLRCNLLHRYGPRLESRLQWRSVVVAVADAGCAGRLMLLANGALEGLLGGVDVGCVPVRRARPLAGTHGRRVGRGRTTSVLPRATRRMWVNESTVFGTIKKDTEKSRRGSPRRASLLPARTAASSYGPASTSIQSTFCRCVLVVSCGGGRSSPRFGDERRTIVPPLFALCMSGQAAAGHYQRAALLQPDFAHCAQSPEHHHRPASCHGELLLRPLARLSRWHTLAICCSRSASSSPHSCHGAVTTHLLAGLSRAGSPAGATRRPLSLVHHGPQRPVSSVREEAVCRHSRAGASGS